MTEQQPRARIGIDLGGTKIAGALLAHGLLPVSRLRRPTPRGDYQGTLRAIGALVAQLEEVWQHQGGSLINPLTLGIGTPGVCLADSGRMSNCNSTWLNGQRLKADLEKYLTRTVFIANDADCFALSQTHLQPGLSQGLTFGIILGTGVGGGWVFDGVIRKGPNALSGEWGHVPLPYFHSNADSELGVLERRLPNRDCYCGRQNCIETFLSGPGLLQTHQALWGQDPVLRSAQDVVAVNSSEGNVTVQLYLDMLARSLGQLINVFDPDCIVIGGGLSNLAVLYDALPREIPAYLFARQSLATPILAPVGGDDSGVIGAALLCDVQPYSILQEP